MTFELGTVFRIKEAPHCRRMVVELFSDGDFLCLCSEDGDDCEWNTERVLSSIRGGFYEFVT